MIEQAFRVSPTSTLYQQYFLADAQKIRFHALARTFFAKHGFPLEGPYTGYYMNENLCMQLSPEEREKYATQLKKLVDANEICYFKKNSKLNKAWQEEVVALCDLKQLDATWCWYFPYINKGKYSLWHADRELYGYLMDEHKTTLDLPDWMERIKMSEYYAIQEALSEKEAT
jgi:hypothetical protein